MAAGHASRLGACSPGKNRTAVRQNQLTVNWTEVVLIRLQKLHIVPCCAVCVLTCLALLATLIAHLSVTQSNPDIVFSRPL